VNPLSSEMLRDVLNLDDVIARFQGDGEFLLRSLELFRAKSQSILSQLHDALNTGDYRQLERSAHSIKGAIANFGATNAIAAAVRLEEAAREQNLQQARSACAVLEDEIVRFMPAAARLAYGIRKK
jgi:two-component system, sensor histidine kinase and response regulator